MKLKRGIGLLVFVIFALRTQATAPLENQPVSSIGTSTGFHAQPIEAPIYFVPRGPAWPDQLVGRSANSSSQIEPGGVLVGAGELDPVERDTLRSTPSMSNGGVRCITWGPSGPM